MNAPACTAIGHNILNFGPPNTVPEKFKDRKFYQHYPTMTLMRTAVEENRKLGEEIGVRP